MQLMPGAYVRAPKNLQPLVGIDHAAETAPAELGLHPQKVDAVWRAVEQMFASGLQPAITLVVKRHGRTVLKRSIGAVRGLDPGVDEPQVALQPDSPMCLFSASKSISALLVHKLIEDGKLSLDDRVAAYIPEFAARGKHRVTLRELMAHRAAIPSLTVETQGAELLKNWDVLIATLCAARPVDREFRQQAYHALTAGFILGEVVQRVGQISLPDALDQWIAKPLGCQFLQYGASPALRAQMPRNVVTGLQPVWPLSAYIRSIIGVDMAEGVAASNEDPSSVRWSRPATSPPAPKMPTGSSRCCSTADVSRVARCSSRRPWRAPSSRSVRSSSTARSSCRCASRPGSCLAKNPSACSGHTASGRSGTWASSTCCAGPTRIGR